ncbi:50S ribosomal protein L25/general stress protein Ctc [Pseudoalteromonas sp. HM-SA03]|uniref:50S ribosomal protein L25/general stress protein Ctc n=1 Tax=unclassified Pseudoalteromonas TaxID=194690 RepID=UPI000BAE4285|nr:MULTISPECIES: 50S ribosomal protein L25/general stress protein Ctc [unclassified Pseudoalteromonas]MCF2828894.1 50S ribosomal protein L25/general stress protein Ctc [Pseudoalteromonas sp. OF5H-5]MCF2833555.1 50S ribosomal protein L25/general stress protein Ctc [Pseudoalteromonas sp. DL2-H6]MCF2926135.1 50S ribosomal protein L25/general stress protein Ctc [Pseudoalteromonas sp. DL2-H1]PAY00695.1 50S ribosomal protein L25/general stress protein Ctc [Pseudoalteromonas sp. HM-SA03]
MSVYKLDAEVRSDLGTGASRRLRRADKVPAILYGAGKDAVSLTFDHNKVLKAQEDEGFYTHILTLNIGGESVEAILKDMQRHPYKPKITHLDFQRVDASQKLHTKVPVHFINEEKATKGGNTIVHQLTEIEITCLPARLPEFIEVDVATLAVGETLHLSDIKLPAGVVSVELAKGADHDQAVVSVNAPKAAPAEESAEDAAE